MSRGASRRTPPPKAARALEQSGASTQTHALKDRWQSYIEHHRSSFHAAMQRLISQPAQTFLTSMVVAIALALPTILLLVLVNIQQLGERWDSAPKLTLYLHEGAKQAAIDQLQSKLDNDLRIAGVRYISSADALSEFERMSGFGAVLSGLDQNPLPAAMEIELHQSYFSADAQQAIAQELSNEGIVAEAAVDLQWVQRFIAMTALVRQIVLFLAGLLAFGAVLAIGNTVRLIIENRKEEIIVIKLVGGTNGFVRRPLLYSGGLYGVFGGLIACVVVLLGFMLLSGSVESIAASYQSDFRMQGLSFFRALQLLIMGMFLGWLGAQLAVGRHLAKIEPR